MWGVSVSVSCRTNPERVTIHNNRSSALTIKSIESIYRPTADEPFYVYQPLPAGTTITYRFGSGDGDNKLSEGRIFADRVATEGVRVAAGGGKTKRLC